MRKRTSTVMALPERRHDRRGGAARPRRRAVEAVTIPFEADPRPMLLVREEDGRVVAANRAARVLWGRHRERWPRLLPDGAMGASQDGRLARQNGRGRCLVWSDGRHVGVECFAANADGIALLCCVMQDAAQAPATCPAPSEDTPEDAHEQQLLAKAVEASRSHVLITDASGHVTYANATMRSLAAEATRGCPLAGSRPNWRFVAPDGQPVAPCAPGSVEAREGAIGGLEYVVELRGGRRVVLSGYLACIENDSITGDRMVAVFQDVTDLVHTRESLRATSSELAATIEASPLAVVSLSEDRVVHGWNPAAERLFGWTADEVIGHPIPTVPRDRECESIAIVGRLALGERFMTVQTTRQRRDGSPVEVSISMAPVLEGDGSVRRYVGIMADVGERKSIAEALQQSRDRDEVLATHAADIALFRFRYGPTPGFDYVGSAITAITGYAPEDFYEDPGLPLRLVHPDDRALLEAALYHASSPAANITIRVSGKDGRPIHLAYNRVAVRDDKGTVRAVEGVLRDVTKHMRLQETLREAQARQDLVLQSVPLVLMALDVRRGFALTWVSDNFAEVSGFARESVARDQDFVRARIHGEDRDEVHSRLQDTLTHGAASFQTHWRCADGLYHLFAVRALLERDSAGVPAQVLASALDTGVPPASDERREEGPPFATPVGTDVGSTPAPTTGQRLGVRLVIPGPAPATDARPAACPYCANPALQRYQTRVRRLRDGEEVKVTRYRCSDCGHTFTHYPPGTGRGSQSEALRLTVSVLYGLGLSARSVSTLLASAGVRVSPRSVWRDSGALAGQMRQSRPPHVVCVLATDERLLHGDSVVVERVQMASAEASPTIDLILWQPQHTLMPWIEQCLRPAGVQISITARE